MQAQAIIRANYAAISAAAAKAATHPDFFCAVYLIASRETGRWAVGHNAAALYMQAATPTFGGNVVLLEHRPELHECKRRGSKMDFEMVCPYLSAAALERGCRTAPKRAAALLSRFGLESTGRRSARPTGYDRRQQVFMTLRIQRRLAAQRAAVLA